jgi:hypothetical protein
MPTEIIYADSSDENAFDLHITWSREQFLQIGLVTRDGTPIGQKWGLTIAVPGAAASSAATTASGFDHSSVWATLTWPGTNALIRKLRRARDDVWGTAA